MGHLFGWSFYLIFLVAIVLIGWERPLKEQLGFKPAPTPPAAVAPQSQPTNPSWMNDNRRWDNAHSYSPPPAATPHSSP